MGYLHINNLYKNQDVLMFKEVYALEKVHGTSAHLAFKKGEPLVTMPRFFAGGESHDKFVALFDKDALVQKWMDLKSVNANPEDVTLYGEAYGGKQQGMSATYGPKLCFIVFDVKIGEMWLDVPQAAAIADHFGLEFVPYEKIEAKLSEVDRCRDMDSQVAVMRGMGPGHKREGIVIRPLKELIDKRGNRVIAKHKRDDFQERLTPQKVVSADKLQVLKDAQAVADEWVTPMRLAHVLDKLPEAKGIEQTRDVIKAMVEDVRREAAGEIVESKEVFSAIGKAAALLFHRQLASGLAKGGG